MKIVTVIGARPQFIKAAVVSHALARHAGIAETLLHTGQHFDANMSSVFFDELDIPQPKYNLGIGGGLHGAMTGAQLAGIEKILLDEKPDWVMVYGDTNSTLAGALAAAKLHIGVAHVEAGLRSFNRRMPEEINRVLTDHVSTALFAPTTTAMENLSHEGIPAGQCHLVGDVMYDAALLYGERARQSSSILEQTDSRPQEYILVTVHRAENTDSLQRLGVIVEALQQLSEDIKVLWPLHPRTRARLEAHPEMLSALGKNVPLTEPVGYLDMVMLEQNSAAIVTDSGGVQKEAFFCGVPCVTLRDETEWDELVKSGWNTLVSPHDVEEVRETVKAAVGSRGEKVYPYGDGSAARAIVAKLL